MCSRLIHSALFSLLLASGGILFSPTQANAGERARDSGHGSACVNRAEAVTSGRWVCVGDQLTYQTADQKWTTERVASVSISVDTNLAPDPSALVDDYDYWCESTGVCARYISSYIAEIKANSYFGVGSETYGNFDQVWRQNFNGPYNRYRLRLIWDGGSAVDSDFWRAQVREQRTGLPDPVKGSATFSPATISSASYGAWSPSSTGYTQVSGRVSSSTATHHDDLYGYFFARGSRWATGTLHLPNFRCPSLRCYYPGA